MIKLQLIFSNFMIMSIFQSFQYIDFSTSIQIISFLSQILYLVCYVGFLVFFYIKIRYLNKNSNLMEVNKYYHFIDHLNINNSLQKYFWFIFELRKILNLAFIFFIPHTVVTLSMILALNISFFIYIIVSKPI